MPTIPASKTLRDNVEKSSSDFLFCSRKIKCAQTGYRIQVKRVELEFDEANGKQKKDGDCASCKKFLTEPKPKPKPVKAKVKPDPPPVYTNIMSDRRVFRGKAISGKSCYDANPFDVASVRRRDKSLQNTQKLCRNLRNVIGTPPPITGRLHEKIQTDKYLEELFLRPAEVSAETQTDIFLEKIPIPPYVPAKVGVDAATQIEEGELFHFDAEAQPLIEILVDGAIEQNILEVVHEQELEALRRTADEYLAKRESELAELRRLEAEEIRLQAEKERRLRQESIAKELDEEMQKGIVAAKILQGHIASLLPEIIDNLEPATASIKKEFMMKKLCTSMSDDIEQEAHHIVDSRKILMSMIKEIVKERAVIYMNYAEPCPPLIQDYGEFEGEEEQCEECCTCESSLSTVCPSMSDQRLV